MYQSVLVSTRRNQQQMAGIFFLKPNTTELNSATQMFVFFLSLNTLKNIQLSSKEYKGTGCKSEKTGIHDRTKSATQDQVKGDLDSDFSLRNKTHTCLLVLPLSWHSHCRVVVPHLPSREIPAHLCPSSLASVLPLPSFLLPSSLLP